MNDNKQQAEPLTEKDLVIGNKYVPKSKNGLGYEPLSNSIVWKRANRVRQAFLYYTGFYEGWHLFNDTYKEGNGDCFLPSDVIPFEPEHPQVEAKKEDEPKDLIDWIGKKGLPQTKDILNELKVINLTKENERLSSSNRELMEALVEVNEFLHVLPMLRLCNKQGFDECVDIKGVTELELRTKKIIDNNLIK